MGGITTTFSYNAADELTSAIGGLTRTYTYDGNGDRTSSSDGTSITVNTAGQLTSITPPGGSAIPYSYTGAGEQQRVGAGSTKYQYDATGLNVQTDSANNKTYFTSLPDGTLLSETIPGGVANAGTYYYLTDGPGNVAAVVDSTGTVRNSYSYDPLGAATVSGSQQVSNPFTFQGWMYASQTGYYYTGSDYYDPATGQSFGCTDKGQYDPGEDCGCPNDSCGEDENSICEGVCGGDPVTIGYERNRQWKVSVELQAVERGTLGQIRVVVRSAYLPIKSVSFSYYVGTYDPAQRVFNNINFPEDKEEYSIEINGHMRHVVPKTLPLGQPGFQLDALDMLFGSLSFITVVVQTSQGPLTLEFRAITGEAFWTGYELV